MGLIVCMINYAILYAFTILLQGQLRIVFPFLFYTLLLISMLVCYLNGRQLNKEFKSFIRMILTTVIPGIFIISIVRLAGANSYFPWNFGLIDIIIPALAIATQLIFLVYKNRKKLI